jgi:hypothetical protein
MGSTFSGTGSGTNKVTTGLVSPDNTPALAVAG